MANRGDLQTTRSRADPTGTKAFSSFTGNAATIGDAVRNSLNISTFTDNGTGIYNYTFTNNFSSVNQVFSSCSGIKASNGYASICGHFNYPSGTGQAPTTSTYRGYAVELGSNGVADLVDVEMVVHGDLA